MKYLIIGGTGSLGKALIRRLSDTNKVGVYSRDEAKQWLIKNEQKNNSNLDFFVGDIRDYNRVESIIVRYNPDVIIIAAALKQVDTCELSPEECIKTNIDGPCNVIRAIERNINFLKCNTVLMVSTDKACEPVNIYGMCKATSERMITSRSSFYDHKKIKFIATRYGNVLDSRGSIIPLFKYQANHSEFITLTHKNMTRFIMTLDESVDLILAAIKNGVSGETWIPKLKAMSILDLASIYAEMSGKSIEYISLRPGEKMHESLICNAESPRARDVGEYYALTPSHQKLSGELNFFNYNSNDAIVSKADLKSYLKSLGHLKLD
jgi:UDP-N-acetylglucosamine 4,6-dehydratase/5-epimerase